MPTATLPLALRSGRGRLRGPRLSRRARHRASASSCGTRTVASSRCSRTARPAAATRPAPAGQRHRLVERADLRSTGVTRPLAAARSARRARGAAAAPPAGSSRARLSSLAIASAIAVGRRRRVLHATARAVAREPVRDVQLLLEVALEREVEERPPRRDELHRRRQPALHDGDVAGVEPAVEVVDVAVQLGRRPRRSPAGSMRGPQTPTMRRPGHEPLRRRLRGEHRLQQVRADARAADRDEADLLVVAPAELAAQGRALGRRERIEARDVPAERRSAPRPTAGSPAGRARSCRGTMSSGSPTKIARSRTRG